MSSSAQDTMAGCPSSSSSVPTKEANPETTLGSAYSPVDYMSITSFPRLPEDDMMSMDNAAKLRSKDDDNVLSEQDTGELLDLSGVHWSIPTLMLPAHLAAPDLQARSR